MTVENTVKVGDTVRSYDFPDMGYHDTGSKAYYVEGVVASIHPDGVKGVGSYPAYEIEVKKRIVGGVESPKNAMKVYPPVNGTQSILGGVTNCVRLVA